MAARKKLEAKAAKVAKAAPKPKREPGNGKWVKGQSGNPSGRPKEIGWVRELARAYTDVAVQTLAQIMQDDKQPAASRVSAAQSLLDRGWGKPSQPVGGADDLPPIRTLRDLTETELMAIAAGEDVAGG